jgi:hypothetical protein
MHQQAACLNAAANVYVKREHQVTCSKDLKPLFFVCYRRAMGGAVKFQDALAERLNLMACSQQQLDAFLKAHPPQYSPGVHRWGMESQCS